jgi:hypothetical protein
VVSGALQVLIKLSSLHLQHSKVEMQKERSAISQEYPWNSANMPVQLSSFNFRII